VATHGCCGCHAMSEMPALCPSREFFSAPSTALQMRAVESAEHVAKSSALGLKAIREMTSLCGAMAGCSSSDLVSVSAGLPAVYPRLAQTGHKQTLYSDGMLTTERNECLSFRSSCYIIPSEKKQRWETSSLLHSMNRATSHRKFV
jgi:hypothetical protein